MSSPPLNDSLIVAVKTTAIRIWIGILEIRDLTEINCRIWDLTANQEAGNIIRNRDDRSSN